MISRTIGAGCAVALPIFLEIKKKAAISTPNNSRFQDELATKVNSTPNISHLPTGLISHSTMHNEKRIGTKRL